MMVLAALLIATGFITTSPTAHAAQAETLLASKPDSSSSGANNWSRRAAISGNGRYVAFESYASNLTTTDGNGQTPDIFVRDLTTNHTVLVSVATDDTQYAAQSLMPAISYDGRYVAFVSQATLESPDTNGYNDIYVRDRDTDNDGIF